LRGDDVIYSKENGLVQGKIKLNIKFKEIITNYFIFKVFYDYILTSVNTEKLEKEFDYGIEVSNRK
jgi:hypothetical protein